MSQGTYYLFPKESIDSIRELAEAFQEAVTEIIAKSQRKVTLPEPRGGAVTEFYNQHAKIVHQGDPEFPVEELF